MFLIHLHARRLFFHFSIYIPDQIENKPGIPPGPHHIATLIDRMKTENISLLLAATYVDPKPARRVAEQSGANLIILPASVEAEPTINTYFDLFETIVTRLASAPTDA